MNALTSSARPKGPPELQPTGGGDTNTRLDFKKSSKRKLFGQMIQRVNFTRMMEKERAAYTTSTVRHGG